MRGFRLLAWRAQTLPLLPVPVLFLLFLRIYILWHGISEAEFIFIPAMACFWPGAGGAFFSCLLSLSAFWELLIPVLNERLLCPYSAMVMITVIMYA